MKIFNPYQLNYLSKIWMPVGKNVVIRGQRHSRPANWPNSWSNAGGMLPLSTRLKCRGLEMVPEETREQSGQLAAKKRHRIPYEGRDNSNNGCRGPIHIPIKTKFKSLPPIRSFRPYRGKIICSYIRILMVSSRKYMPLGDCQEPGLIPDAGGQWCRNCLQAVDSAFQSMFSKGDGQTKQSRKGLKNGCI